MGAPREILDLVERFGRNLEAYRSGKYNETQIRVEFIDPFFEALGWDVHNKEGYAEPYKDVIHEDAIKLGGATKAPSVASGSGRRRLTRRRCSSGRLRRRTGRLTNSSMNRTAWPRNKSGWWRGRLLDEARETLAARGRLC